MTNINIDATGATGANPTATASDTAVNGVATTFLRSDGAPAIQKTSASVFGVCKVDGSTITASGGVISSTGGTGTVTTTGSPASGNLTKFSGATSITNGDLSGDVTTSGTLVVTLAASGVTAATYGDSTHVPQIAVDAKGRITSASNVAISGAGTQKGLQYPFKSGRLYSSPWNNDNNTALGANVIWLTPFVVETVNSGVTFTTASIYVSSAATAGKVARLMVFQDNSGTAGGGTLEVDIGTVAVDSTGVVTKGFSHAFTAGQYWLAIWSDGNPSIRGTGTASQINSYMNGFLHTTGDFPVNGEKASSAFGAAPATCPAITTTLNGNVLPLLYLNF